MSEWVVTYTSMPIEADSAEEAIEREGNGGGHWNAYPVRQRPGALEAHAAVWPGDADLPVVLGTVGGLRLAMYQDRDTDDGPLPVVVLDLDRDDLELDVRIYVGDAPGRHPASGQPVALDPLGVWSNPHQGAGHPMPPVPGPQTLAAVGGGG